MMEQTPLSPIFWSKTMGKGSSPAPVQNAVLYTAQALTSAQQAQARANIGATDAETSIPDNVKSALLDCFANVAWATEDGQQYYDALEAALYPLDHITAVYTQSGTVYDTDSLDSLKANLVVTAFYQSGDSKVVTDYTLSGTLTVGTSTITVSYGGQTTTFDVVVTESQILPTDYQQVEYIANPSDAYFISSINVPRGYSVHGKAHLLAKPSEVMNVCGGVGAYNRSFACFSAQTENYIGTWYGTTNAFTSLNNLYATPTEFTTTIANNSISISVKNDDGEGAQSATITTTDTANMQVFRAGSGYFAGRLFFLEVLNPQNEATAKLIPCYRKADNVVGMYDVVNNTFYSSASSTAFTKGGDV